MGITIHFDTKFVGSERQLKKKLNEIIEKAKQSGFKDAKLFEMDFAKSYNEIDDFTPIGVNENGEVIIDEEYRWAKIQAAPRAPIMSYQDTPSERAKKEIQAAKFKEDLPKMHGFVANLWWGEGCEPTNLVFVCKRGKSSRRTWKGYSFTKTQYASDFVKAHMTVCALLKYAQNEGLVTDVRDEADFYESGAITELIDASEENLKIIAAFGATLVENFGKENIQGAGKNASEILKDYQTNS